MAPHSEGRPTLSITLIPKTVIPIPITSDNRDSFGGIFPVKPTVDHKVVAYRRMLLIPAIWIRKPNAAASNNRLQAKFLIKDQKLAVGARSEARISDALDRMRSSTNLNNDFLRFFQSSQVKPSNAETPGRVRGHNTRREPRERSSDISATCGAQTMQRTRQNRNLNQDMDLK